MKKGSWACTVFTQVCVCIAIYVAFHLGQPQEEARRGYYGMIRRTGFGGGGDGGDVEGEGGNEVYFITVRGCVRPESKQNRVLKLMEKVARAYSVEFVVDITEDGVEDVLLQKGTEYYRSLKIPWYTTKASTRGDQHHRKLIKFTQGKTLALFGVDTSFSMGAMPNVWNEQPQRPFRTPMETNNLWNIYVGLHPVISCQNNISEVEAKEPYQDTLHDMFPRYGVNAYLTGRNCTDLSCQGGINYIASPEPWNTSTHSASWSSSRCSSKPCYFCRELEDGILLHRVNSQEIATFFISLSGRQFYRIIIQKKGSQVM